MLITITTLMALIASLSFLFYLRNTDSKRRRSHHLPAWEKQRYTKQAWILSLLPGMVLLCIQSYAAFIMWFAAFSLIGWFVALPKPKSKPDA